MADIELVIKIPEETYKDIQSRDWKNGELVFSDEWKAIHNGTPLDTHDEEIIATTVESIWGKPPYTELLDNLRAEIDRQEKWLLQAGYTAYNTDIAFDAIKSVLKGANE